MPLEEERAAVLWESFSVTWPGMSTMVVDSTAACFTGVACMRSDHLPVGVSGQSRIKRVATLTIRMPGTTKETLHATCSVRPCCVTKEL